jgi:ABC-type antimicrobial peptide transport system permease subunit
VFDIAPTDPGVLVFAAAVLIGVALAAALTPARRAASVDPIVALRTE